MLNNYFKIAWRTMQRHKGYAFINVAGLAVGLACCVLIVLYVQDERSYDRFHTKAAHIYRMGTELQTGTGVQRMAQSPPAWMPSLLIDYPEMAGVVRFKPPRQGWMVHYESDRFFEKRWTFADSTVFDVFDITLVRGDPKTALRAPFTVVLTEAMARKYFGADDPIGKTLTLDNQYRFEITGIMQPLPANAHFHVDFLASFISLKDPEQLYFLNVTEAQFPFVYTYVLLHEGEDAATLAQKLPDFVARRVPPAFRQPGSEMRAFLQPLADIHLHSDLQFEIEPNGNIASVRIFSVIALFVLLIACVNFMNLTTARSAGRAKEVGLRKVVGASRSHLIGQFLGESTLLALFALVLAFVLVYVALPAFNTLSGKMLTFADLMKGSFVLALPGTALIVGLIAGSYPAFFLSAFRPATVLKDQAKGAQTGRALVRKALIVFQFTISVVLIIGTVVVYTQMDHIRTMQLGLDKEHLVVLPLTDPAAARQYEPYKDALLQHPNVLSVSGAHNAPATLAGFNRHLPFRPVEASEDESWLAESYFSDYDFIRTLGLELVAGRAFSRDFSTDTVDALILNEAALRAFGWQDPQTALGKEVVATQEDVYLGDRTRPKRVIGVVQDFHSESAREGVAPTVIGYNRIRHHFAFVRIRPDDTTETIAFLRRTWEGMIPAYTFTYSFLDEDFDRLYEAEDVLGKLLVYFALLTVFIACLGLFGLAAFAAEQRTKEIGVRKVLGASVPGVAFLLSAAFTRLVFLAVILAVPVAYLAMNRWLDTFAYRIEISWPIFLMAGLTALLIAWLTIGYQSIKAALANPVEVLRYE